MSSMISNAAPRRAVPFAAALFLASAAFQPLSGQSSATTKQQRDSIARADSIKHAGHDMPGMKMPAATPQKAPGQADQMAPMLADPLGVSMERMGSGTTWIPDAAILPSAHFMAGQWDLMLHGFVFGQYDKQGGPRGNDQWGSLNWGMFMASHELAGGRFQARTMLSLDPA